MMTIEPEPMNGPPSLRCQWGASGLPRSTLRPRMEFSMERRFRDPSTGLVRCEASGALAHPDLERVEGFQRRVDAERQCRALWRRGGVGEDAETRRMPLDCGRTAVAGHSALPAATSVMPPSSNFGSAPLMRRNTPSSSTCLMKPRKSLYITIIGCRLLLST